MDKYWEFEPKTLKISSYEYEKMLEELKDNSKEIKELKRENERLIELLPELVETLNNNEKFLLNVKFYPDGCNCYDDYICQLCTSTKLWSETDNIIKKAKELIENE